MTPRGDTASFLNALRDPKRVKRMLGAIKELTAEPVAIMEVCGGHTRTIVRYGLEQLLPKEISFLHGPGCPVCVTPRERVDMAVALAQKRGLVLATLGDMLRVPGSSGSLLQARASGCDIRVVYSPLDVIALAKQNPKKTVVFFAVGFETTAPTTAALLERCLMEGTQNVKVLVNHVLVAPAIEALLKEDGSRIDAFIAPGHVCTITGTAPFEPLASCYQKPFVVSGFEPWDILLGLHNLLGMIANKETGVNIAYTRAVLPQGNPKALSFIERFFDVRESFRWRGLGNIPKSALRLKHEFSAFDAEKAYAGVFSSDSKPDPEACLCGEVLKGNAKPSECVLFGQACTPQDPVGACMVSSEGACGIYFRYKGREPA